MYRKSVKSKSDNLLTNAFGCFFVREVVWLCRRLPALGDACPQGRREAHASTYSKFSSRALRAPVRYYVVGLWVGAFFPWWVLGWAISWAWRGRPERKDSLVGGRRERWEAGSSQNTPPCKGVCHRKPPANPDLPAPPFLELLIRTHA